MVFKGRLSAGCESCRKLHTKCDGLRPSCSRCIRTHKHCIGYRDEVDLLFRHVIVKPKKVNRLSGIHIKNPTVGSALVSDRHGSQLATFEARLLISKEIGLPSKEDLPLCYFYSTVLDSLVATDHSRFLHLQLPALLSRGEKGSVLRIATEAISLATWARSNPIDHERRYLSRKRYLEALAVLNTALQDPYKSRSDDTLYAVLLLSGYETTTFDSNASHGWGVHVDGATSLLKHRGKDNFTSPFACSMFLFARRSAVLNQLQKSQPLDAIFEKSSEMLVLTENMEDKLLSKAVRIPILLSQVNSLLAGEKSLVDYNAVSKFIRLAENLDDELTLWATRLPSEWSYTAVINIKSFSNFEKAHSIYYPNQIHRYPNLYAARLWNFYRVYRIIIQSILCRLSSVYSVEYKQDEQSQIQSRISCDLASDICASVPFLLGYDLSNLAGMQSVKYPWVQPSEESYLWPQNFLQIPTSGLSKGKFSLIWPLHVASSAKFLPEVQRKWMRAQLQWMAHIGEAHARLILYAESQILYGGTESFRFDCV